MCYCYNSYFIVILGSFFLLSLLISLKSTHPSCCHLGVYFQSQEMIFEGLGEKKIHPFWYFYLKFYLFSVIQLKLFYLTFGGKKDFRKREGKIILLLILGDAEGGWAAKISKYIKKNNGSQVYTTICNLLKSFK